MSSNYQISTNSLTVGAKIFVEGITTYSRLAKHIEGDELQKDMARKQQMGMNPITRPYTTISIRDAKIRPQNPANLSVEEMYVQERFYMKQDVDPNTKVPTGNTYIYTVNNKSPFLPNISQYEAESNVAKQIDLNGQELDTGLKVILCLSVYQPKTYSNKGIGLDGIIVMDPIRFYSASGNDLSALGITYQPLPGDEARAAVTPHVDNTATQTTGAQPVAAPTPAMQPNTPVQPVATAPTPVGGTPQIQQPVAQTPVQPATQNPLQNTMNTPVMGDPETPWICPSCGTTNTANQKFCGNCGNQKPAANAVNNPYAQQLNPVQPTSGIVYEPNPTDRNY